MGSMRIPAEKTNEDIGRQRGIAEIAIHLGHEFEGQRILGIERQRATKVPLALGKIGQSIAHASQPRLESGILGTVRGGIAERTPGLLEFAGVEMEASRLLPDATGFGQALFQKPHEPLGPFRVSGLEVKGRGPRQGLHQPSWPGNRRHRLRPNSTSGLRPRSTRPIRKPASMRRLSS